MYLLPVIGIAGIIATVVMGQVNFLILSLYLVIPLLFVSVIYKSLGNSAERGLRLDGSTFTLFLIAYLLCYSLSILLLTVYDVRPLTYFIIVVTMAVTLLVEITGFKVTGERITIILLQIMGLIVNLHWGVTLNYFRFIGRTDVMIHTQYLNSLIQTGHVTEVFFDYQPFPLWHILNATIYLLGGNLFPPDKVIAIASGLIFLCLPVLAYLLSVRLFDDRRTGLIAALISFFFPNIAYLEISGISRSIAGILLVFLIYLLIDRKNKYKWLLIGIVTIGIIVYHSISIIFVLLILSALYLLQKVFLEKEVRYDKLNIGYLAIATVITLAYWFTCASIVIRDLINNIVVRAPTGVLTKSVISSPVPEIFNYLQYSPAVLFILIGVVAVLLSSRFGGGAKIFSLMAFIFMWVTFPGPQFLFNKLISNLGVDRFAEYTYIILILVSAAGFAILFQRSNRYVRTGLILLFAVWVMLSISNDWVASDNPLVKRPFYTYYLTETEIAGFDHIAANTTEMVTSDLVATRYFDSAALDTRSEIMEVSGNVTDALRAGDDDMILVRYAELERRPLKISVIADGIFTKAPWTDTYTYIGKESGIWDHLDEYDKVYDSPAMGGYV